MFWVLILSIVCLCQGFQLCIVCKIGKTLLRKVKQVLIMKKKTCCGFNIYSNICPYVTLCKQYHVTIRYKDIILQHLNIYSVNVDNPFRNHMKVLLCDRHYIINRNKIIEEQRGGLCSIPSFHHQKFCFVYNYSWMM